MISDWRDIVIASSYKRSCSACGRMNWLRRHSPTPSYVLVCVQMITCAPREVHCIHVHLDRLSVLDPSLAIPFPFRAKRVKHVNCAVPPRSYIVQHKYRYFPEDTYWEGMKLWSPWHDPTSCLNLRCWFRDKSGNKHMHCWWSPWLGHADSIHIGMEFVSQFDLHVDFTAGVHVVICAFVDHAIARSLDRSLGRALDHSFAWSLAHLLACAHGCRSLDRTTARSIARSLDRSLGNRPLIVTTRHVLRSQCCVLWSEDTSCDDNDYTTSKLCAHNMFKHCLEITRYVL